MRRGRRRRRRWRRRRRRRGLEEEEGRINPFPALTSWYEKEEEGEEEEEEGTRIRRGSNESLPSSYQLL